MSDFAKEALKKAKQLRDEARTLERIASRYQDKPVRHKKHRRKKKSKPA